MLGVRNSRRIDAPSPVIATEAFSQESCNASSEESYYEAYFGLGHVLRLVDRPGVFKLSPAGLALGDYLVRSVDPRGLRGPVLDMGTGSGALALLLRNIGVRSIVAMDISAAAVKAAMENELLNFPDSRIAFHEGSLFEGPATNGPFDLIVFNPPGWRTPSATCRRDLAADRAAGLDLSAMFSGEKVLLEFLLALPRHLAPAGRAVIGLNSLTGIRSVMSELMDRSGGNTAVDLRLIERHSFPLFLYTRQWQASRDILLAEFQRWREKAGAAFSITADGTLYWSYEIVECRLKHPYEGARTCLPRPE
ncbi:methyltransferase [Streptomyces sp. NPDC051776]|uniref:methyltransferase n=1 Tax=Streptomyces sp. NPDC051776 TaxID=3155414 RepID=UPI00341B9416